MKYHFQDFSGINSAMQTGLLYGNSSTELIVRKPEELNQSPILIEYNSSTTIAYKFH